jgi:hypothetical protein
LTHYIKVCYILLQIDRNENRIDLIKSGGGTRPDETPEPAIQAMVPIPAGLCPER